MISVSGRRGWLRRIWALSNEKTLENGSIKDGICVDIVVVVVRPVAWSDPYQVVGHLIGRS